MAKAVINKHINNHTEINEEFFVNDLELAKGEIIICNNPDDPSIFIMDANGIPTKIAGESYDDTAIYNIAYNNANNIKKIEDIIGITGESGDTIFGVIDEVKTNVENNLEVINEYTVNNKKISENPVFTTDDFKVDESYTTIRQSSSNITIGDELTTALSKLTVLINNLNLVVASSINSLESRIKVLEYVGTPAEYNENSELIKEATGLFKEIEDLKK